MKKCKMLVSDYDGTLITKDQKILECNLKAIKDFTSRGGIFVVCTGRMSYNIVRFLRNYGIDGTYACLNGAVVADIKTGEKYYDLQMSNSDAVEFCRLAESVGAYIQAYPNDTVITNKDNELADMYRKLMNCVVTPVGSLEEYFKKEGIKNSKFFLINEKEHSDRIMEVVKPLNNTLKIIRADDYIIEVTVKEATKGNAVKFLSKKFNVDTSEIACVGDSGNDAPMLEVAGLPIAMGNAVEELKKIAKVIAPDNTTDAIKFIIDNYCI